MNDKEQIKLKEATRDRWKRIVHILQTHDKTEAKKLLKPILSQHCEYCEILLANKEAEKKGCEEACPVYGLCIELTLSGMDNTDFCDALLDNKIADRIYAAVCADIEKDKEDTL